MRLPLRTTTRRDYATDHRSAASRAALVMVALLPIAACSKDSSGPDPAADCVGADATTPAVGGVSVVSGTSVCLGGGSAGAQYALVSFNSDTLSAKRTFEVTANGVVAPGSIPVSMSRVSTRTAILSELASEPMVRRDDAFDARLRAREAELTHLIPEARRRAALRNRSTLGSRAVIPADVTVGQLLQLNTNSNEPCKDPIFAIGRVAVVTSKSVIVADTTNPANGFTDADYAEIARTFDEVVDPVNTANFGAPADIDNNSRILLFFTRSVNEMTPEDNKGSYVGGFFFGRDLFPPTGPVNQSCASSNFGELFYLIVPDPTGIVNNNQFSTAQVREIAVSIIAHEYQHLINASRRIYISTTAEELEVGWLNEGLSHIAEELLFYARSGFAPRQDLAPAQIRSSQRALDAFNGDMGGNFGRLRRYLENPSSNSPYADNDSLATRGATWAFLRYAADQKAGAQAPTWFALVNNGPVGFANIQGVFGSASATLFRDWSTSVFTDNVTGVAPRYQQPSWNYRLIYPEITNPPAYPLKTVTLADAVPESVQLVGGGAAFLRFQVPAGGTGRVTWAALPPKVQMTLVRTR